MGGWFFCFGDQRSVILRHSGSHVHGVFTPMGMVNIERNAIIKLFSVAAVVFLAPTLIASIYGMNFDFMPEPGWPLGYPFAVMLMILSAILPYRIFKSKG